VQQLPVVRRFQLTLPSASNPALASRMAHHADAPTILRLEVRPRYGLEAGYWDGPLPFAVPLLVAATAGVHPPELRATPSRPALYLLYDCNSDCLDDWLFLCVATDRSVPYRALRARVPSALDRLCVMGDAAGSRVWVPLAGCCPLGLFSAYARREPAEGNALPLRDARVAWDAARAECGRLMVTPRPALGPFDGVALKYPDGLAQSRARRVARVAKLEAERQQAAAQRAARRAAQQPRDPHAAEVDAAVRASRTPWPAITAWYDARGDLDEVEWCSGAVTSVLRAAVHLNARRGYPVPHVPALDRLVVDGNHSPRLRDFELVVAAWFVGIAHPSPFWVPLSALQCVAQVLDTDPNVPESLNLSYSRALRNFEAGRLSVRLSRPPRPGEGPVPFEHSEAALVELDAYRTCLDRHEAAVAHGQGPGAPPPAFVDSSGVEPGSTKALRHLQARVWGEYMRMCQTALGLGTPGLQAFGPAALVAYQPDEDKVQGMFRAWVTDTLEGPDGRTWRQASDPAHWQWLMAWIEDKGRPPTLFDLHGYLYQLADRVRRRDRLASLGLDPDTHGGRA